MVSGGIAAFPGRAVLRDKCASAQASDLPLDRKAQVRACRRSKIVATKFQTSRPGNDEFPYGRSDLIKRLVAGVKVSVGMHQSVVPKVDFLAQALEVNQSIANGRCQWNAAAATNIFEMIMARSRDMEDAIFKVIVGGPCVSQLSCAQRRVPQQES